MSQLELPGLEATNPLGFLAALGTLTVCERMSPDRTLRLSWTDTVVPTPRLHGVATFDEVVDAVLVDRDLWTPSVALDWPTADRPWTDVKGTTDEIGAWLTNAHAAASEDGGRALSLVTALVGEISVDQGGKAKPSDLHFTAGQQRFLSMARQLRETVDAERLIEGLAGPWRYDSDAPSLMWDVTDDRVYALSATDPAKDKKRTVPGAEWLALMGLTCLPVVGRQGRTQTPGCSGEWHRGGAFSWPVWRSALPLSVVRSLLTLDDLRADDPPPSLAARGVIRVCRSRITRSAQGGYGSFRPTDLVFDEQ